MYGMGFNQYTVNGQAVLNAVANYFGSADPFYLSFAEYGLDAPGALRALEQVPNVRVVRSVTGSPLNIEYFADEAVVSSAERAALATASAINSNTASAAARTTGVSVATHVVEEAGTATAIATGAVSTGGTVVSAICTKVLPSLWAVGTGWSIGCAIDEALYETGNDIWNIGSMRAYNPDYWDDIIFDKDVLGNNEPTMTGLLDANGQMYTDERMLAYLVGYLNSIGAFDSEDSPGTATNPDYPGVTLKVGANRVTVYGVYQSNPVSTLWGFITGSGYIVAIAKNDTVSNNEYSVCFLSTQPFTCGFKSNGTGSWQLVTPSTQTTSPNGHVFYQCQFSSGTSSFKLVPNPFVNPSDYYYMFLNKPGELYDFITDGTLVFPTGVEGINKRTGYDFPDISPDDTIDQILTKLKQQYPDLWTNKLKTSMPDEQGTIRERNYVPMGMPDGGTYKQPTISDDASPIYDPSNQTQSDTIVRSSTPTGNPTNNDNYPDNGNDTGDGSSPVVSMPIGSASSLYTVYNPSESEIQSFGAWLWSPNFVDQLLKMFQDPMQAIIGLHKIFVTPQISGRQNITVGYLDSGVPANKVSHQYTLDNLGTVDLKEYFGNVFDYTPFTKISLFLPFVGFVDLDPADVMRSKITVIYKTDVLTGSTLVEVDVKRDGHLNTLYTYSCDAAVHYPLSSMSYMNIVSTAVGMIGAGIASALVPGAGAAVAGAYATTNAARGVLSGGGGITIQRSGNIGGNSGAMGVKKPYLVITRPQTRVARTAPHHQGYPSNFSTTLSECTGFARVKTAMLSSIGNATDKEKRMLENLLKDGVIV